jgi:hypothetical protein
LLGYQDSKVASLWLDSSRGDI